MQRKEGRRDRQCGGKPAGIWPHKLRATQRRMSPGLPILPERFFTPPPSCSVLYEWTYMTCWPDSVHSWSCWNAWIRAFEWIAGIWSVIKRSFDVAIVWMCVVSCKHQQGCWGGGFFKEAWKARLVLVSETNFHCATGRQVQYVHTVATAPVARCPPRKVKRVWFMSRAAD